MNLITLFNIYYRCVNSEKLFISIILVEVNKLSKNNGGVVDEGSKITEKLGETNTVIVTVAIHSF